MFSKRNGALLAAGLAIALVVAFLSPLASGEPDGLERVAEDEGFMSAAQDAGYELLPDYTVPGIDNEAVTTIAAGVIGVLVVAGLALGAGRLLARRERSSGGDAGRDERAAG